MFLLLSHYYFFIIHIADGSVAHLGERLHGMEEVEGSIPFRSTINALYPSPWRQGFREKIEKMASNSAQTLKQAMKCPEKSGFFLVFGSGFITGYKDVSTIIRNS